MSEKECNPGQMQNAIEEEAIELRKLSNLLDEFFYGTEEKSEKMGEISPEIAKIRSDLVNLRIQMNHEFSILKNLCEELQKITPPPPQTKDPFPQTADRDFSTLVSISPTAAGAPADRMHDPSEFHPQSDQ